MPYRALSPNRTLAVFLFVFLVTGSSDLAARQSADNHATLGGIVVDGSNGQPIVGAWVGLQSRATHTFTDRQGRFQLRDLPAGPVEIVVEQLGYDAWSQTHSLEAGTGVTVRIELKADPVILPGIQIYADRLRARRNALATSVRAFDSAQITASPAFDALEFVQGRALTTIRCHPSMIATRCILRRGRIVAPQIVVNDVRWGPGLEILRMFDTSEIWFIEVLASGAQVRLYTKAFAERLALGKQRMMPVIY